MQNLENQRKQMVAYLDTMCRPLDCHYDGRIPDGLPNNSTMLVDYFEQNPCQTPINNSGGNYQVYGYGVMLSIGQNVLQNGSYDISAETTRANALYGATIFYLGANGQILNWDSTLLNGVVDDVKQQVADATSPYWSIDPENMLDIVGSENGIDQGISLVTQYRVLGAAIRLLPTIELVTDSTTTAVARYYGCSVTPTSINDAYNDGTSMYVLARDSQGYAEYTNAEGITGRLNPYQPGILKLTEMQALQNWSSDTFNTSNMYFPTLLVRFTTNITVGDTSFATMPMRLTYRIYLEGCLSMPTPIISDKVDYVPGCYDMARAVAFDVVKFPVIVSGHSLKEITMAVFDTIALVDPRYKAFSVLGRAFLRNYDYYTKASPKERINKQLGSKLMREQVALENELKRLKNKPKNNNNNNVKRKRKVRRPNFISTQARRMQSVVPQSVYRNANNVGVTNSNKVIGDIARFLPISRKPNNYRYSYYGRY
jgi:hypothetical protein